MLIYKIGGFSYGNIYRDIKEQMSNFFTDTLTEPYENDFIEEY